MRNTRFSVPPTRFGKGARGLGLYRWFGLASAVAALAMVIAACGGADPTATPVPQPTATRAATPAAAATTAPAQPTATRPPGTAAPQATTTPTQPAATRGPLPTATPSPVPPTRTAAAVQPKYGGSLKIGNAVTPTATGNFRMGLQPPGVSSSVGALVLYNGLIIFDPYQGNTAITAELAESWSYSSDATQLTFKLRPGVKWHDGAPFTSKDVEYSINLRLKPPQGFVNTQAMAWLSATFESMTTPDPQTIVIKLNGPNASFVARATEFQFVMLPSHVSLESLASKPIGTGPYVYKSFRQDVAEEYTRNPTYFKKTAGGQQLPYMDDATMFAFRDRALAAAAFRTGQLNHLNAFQTSTVGPVKDEIARSLPGAQFHQLILGFHGAMFKNIPPWNNPKIRQAIEIWLDRKAFVDIGFLGVGCYYPAGVICQEQGGKWGLPPEEVMKRTGYRYLDAQGQLIDTIAKLQAKRSEIKKDPKDLQRAKELLAEAGIRPGTLKTKVEIHNVESQRGGPVFVAQMSELFGVTWESTSNPNSGQYAADIIAGNYGVTYIGYGFGMDDPGFTLENWGSKFNHYAGSGWPADQKLDSLLAEQNKILDFNKRREVVWEIQRLVLDHPLRTIATQGHGYYASAPDMRDPPQALTSFSNVWTYDRIWLDKK